MKTLCFFISLVVLTTVSKAQTSVGITAGTSFANMNVKSEGVTISPKLKTGFTSGVTVSVAMGKNFMFRPELNYVQKGTVIEAEGDKMNVTLNYVEHPINFVYNTSNTKGKFFVGGGPSIAYGISGKYSGSEEGDIKFGSGEEDNFKPFEFGVNALAGYQFSKGVFFTANYNFGLSNISVYDDEKDHNNFFAFKIGYMFPGKKK